MLALLRNLFMHRSMSRSRFGGLSRGFSRHRRGIGFGSLAAIAAPYVVRRLMSRRQRGFGGAY